MIQAKADTADRALGTADPLGAVLTAAVALLVVIAPLPFGAAAPWAQRGVLLVSLFLLGLWAIRAGLRGGIHPRLGPGWLLVLLGFGLAALQLAPLPLSWVRVLSPEAARLWSDARPGCTAVPLSLDPRSTVAAMARFGALAAVCFVTIHGASATRRRVKVLLLALAVTGAFQVLYGFAEHFSGHDHIFWNPRQYHLPAVTGTFLNKNHFAGLLEMIIPVLLGLFMAAAPRGIRTPSTRTRLVHAFVAPGTWRQCLFGALLILMTVGLFFSLSRAGILCAVASWAIFALILSMAARFRKYTLVLLLLVAVSVCLAVSIGAGLVIDGIEDAASGRSTSFADRVDLWRSGLEMVRAFPIAGTGLGTFAAAFERFQSARFGDRTADFLHNDWLQLFCEMGVPAALLLCGGLLLGLRRLFAGVLTRHDPFCRWTGTGALAGVCAMLLHSGLDYNLYKIPANGVVFVVLLGLSRAAMVLPHRGSRSEGVRGDGFRLTAAFRLALPAAVLPALLLPAAWALRTARADLRFNRYLAHPGVWGRTGDYHFLPVNPEGGASAMEDLRAARALDPKNPGYLRFAAVEAVKEAETVLRAQAEKTARELLEGGPEISTEAFRRIREAMERSLEPRAGELCREELLRAEGFLRQAIRNAPARAALPLELAEVEARLGRLEEALAAAERARVLAPAKPSVLFAAGRIFMERAFAAKDSRDRRRSRNFALSSFRRALAADPSYADRIYPMVQAVLGGSEALVEVTPRRADCYRNLVEALWSEGRWKEVLACLDAERRFPRGPWEHVRLRELSTRRCAVLGLLGAWKERAREAARLQALAKEETARRMEEARALRSRGLHREALRVYREVLRTDWKNPEALVATADLAGLPRRAGEADPPRPPIHYLLRLVLNEPPLPERLLVKVQEILETLQPETPEARFRRDLVRGAALFLAGRPEEATEVLEPLAGRAHRKEETPSPSVAHLAEYFLGRALEAEGREEAAAAAYRKVLEQAPRHLAALKRLRALEGPGVRSGPVDPLHGLLPSIPCRVEFGGRITLLGLDLRQERTGNGERPLPWVLTSYWLVRDGEPPCRPFVQVLDRDRKALFRDDVYLPIGANPGDGVLAGEVVKARSILALDPREAAYLRFGVTTLPTPLHGPEPLLSDGGDRFFLTTLEALAGS